MSFEEKLLSSGWGFEGKNWYISEIEKKITLENEIVLFDFITTNAIKEIKVIIRNYSRLLIINLKEKN